MAESMYIIRALFYAESKMGTAESVIFLTANQINEFKREYFCPANAFVTVVGAYTDDDFAAAKQDT